MTAKAMVAWIRGERHVYLSTACYHQRHDQCREGCKFCQARCCCACHPAQRRAGT